MMKWRGPRHYVVRGTQIVVLVGLVVALIAWRLNYFAA